MKFVKSFLLAGAVLATCGLSADPLSNPYASIHPLAPTPYYVDNGYLIENLVTSSNATVFVDVGSPCGAVARLIAQNTTGVQVINVNMWLSCDTSQKYLFQKFLSNVINENTTATITPFRMSSLEAAKALNIVADVIYLDNTEQSLSAEILAWAQHLTPTGNICGHDYVDASVQFSVAQAANKLGFNVVNQGDFWYLTRN